MTTIQDLINNGTLTSEQVAGLSAEEINQKLTTIQSIILGDSRFREFIGLGENKLPIQEAKNISMIDFDKIVKLRNWIIEGSISLRKVKSLSTDTINFITHDTICHFIGEQQIKFHCEIL